MTEEKVPQAEPGLIGKASDAWTDLVLTLPLFIGYHIGVVFLPIRNAADVVTAELVTLAESSMLAYMGLTLGIGIGFVAVLMVLGRGKELHWERFVMLGIEGALYAVAMRLIAGFVVGKLALAEGPMSGGFTGAIMSAGAGFYEEIAFRVILFGVGVKLLQLTFPSENKEDRLRPNLIELGWGVTAAGIFSGWHYVGAMGDAFELRSFVFRWVCGIVFTVIYRFRGFAPAVYTHALYDVWVLVF
jgi:hypothetical protein